MYSGIEKFCVRVKRKGIGNGLTGSGVILSGKTSLYVLTAAHCLGNEPKVDNILIERQIDYASAFNQIKLVDIVEYNKEHDFALIEICIENEESFLCDYKLGIGFLNESKVKFCGYQGVNVDQFRPFNGTVLTISDELRRFKITLSNETFDQAGENGSFLAKGLSGSGVFIYRHNSPFLIGILKSVITDKAWNDDIECCAISHLEKYISEFVNLSDFESLRKWNEIIDKQATEREIDAFKQENSEFFNHLYRKNNILYPEKEKADEVTVKQIRTFLAMKENIKDLENNSPFLYSNFKEVVKAFVNRVEDDYSGSVQNSREAREVKIQLQDSLKNELAFLPSFTNISLSEFQIIEWLGICTLDFS